MIPDALWESLLRDLPTTAIIMAVVFGFAKYLDKWLGKFAATSETAAERRQSQILSLLEKLMATYADTDRRLTAVIEANTKAMDKISESTLRQAEALAALVQADAQQAANIRDLTASMIEHYKDVASRPCQIAVSTKTRPSTPRGER